MRVLGLIGTALTLAAFLVGTLLVWESSHFAAPGPAAETVSVIVKPGTSLRGIAEDLAHAGAVDNAFLFRIGVSRRGAGAALEAGEYAIPPHASMAAIMAMLVNHRAVEHHITIPEGLTSAMAVAVVKADPVLTGDPGPVPPEGSLLPETYLFERGTTRAAMLKRMHQAQAALMAKLWPKRKRDLPIATPEDAIILASMVEKETSVPEERGHIAAVFMNRLRDHMRLESDPTIIYGLTKGVPLGHPLRVSELAKPNPYSTYQIDGLPPTPICNPGRDAIAAVLDPPDSDDLYFVADGTGGHVFAKTYAQHSRNVAALRRRETRRKNR